MRFKHIDGYHFPKLTSNTLENGSRNYKTPDGNIYPSVTTVMSLLSEKSIANWKGRIGEENANEIGRIAVSMGTRFHSACEDYLNNKKPTLNNMFDQVRFKQSISTLNKINNIIAQEVPLYSDFLQMAGTVDCIADFDGIRSIIDFKTSDKIKNIEWLDGYFLQGTSYSIMFEELFGESIEQVVIIICFPNMRPQVVNINRNDYKKKLIDVRNQYKIKYKV